MVNMGVSLHTFHGNKAVGSHEVHGQDGRGITQRSWSRWSWVHKDSMVRMAVGSHTLHGQHGRGFTQSPWSG